MDFIDELSYPLWIMVRKDCLEKMPSGKRIIKKDAYFPVFGEEAVFPVFTTGPNADAFASENGIRDIEIIGADNPEQFVELLDRYVKLRSKEAVFDPASENPAVYPVDYLIERLK
jgi:hypothetical protein